MEEYERISNNTKPNNPNFNYCSECGKEITDLDIYVNYCGECGTKIYDIDISPQKIILSNVEKNKQITSVDIRCNFCGKTTPFPYKDCYGRFFCKEHVLPENRGEKRSIKPPDDYSVIYHANGKTEIRK